MVARITCSKVRRCVINWQPDATFSCEGLPDISTLKAYVDWMKAIATVTFPDSSYDLHSRTSNANEVVFFATFKGTHSGCDCCSSQLTWKDQEDLLNQQTSQWPLSMSTLSSWRTERSDISPKCGIIWLLSRLLVGPNPQRSCKSLQERFNRSVTNAFVFVTVCLPVGSSLFMPSPSSVESAPNMWSTGLFEKFEQSKISQPRGWNYCSHTLGGWLAKQIERSPFEGLQKLKIGQCWELWENNQRTPLNANKQKTKPGQTYLYFSP